MKSIVVTTDLSDESTRAFDVAIELAKSLNAKVSVLTVIEDPAQAALFYAMDFPVLPEPGLRAQVVSKITSQAQALAKKHFGAFNYECVVREATGAVYEEILKFADSIPADYLVLSTHGRTGLPHLLIGSVAERVARESKRPVVIVPTKKS